MRSGARLAVLPSLMENAPYTVYECLVSHPTTRRCPPPHIVQEEVLQHSVLTSHNTPVPTTPYSPAGGTRAHSVLTSHNTPVPTTPGSRRAVPHARGGRRAGAHPPGRPRAGARHPYWVLRTLLKSPLNLNDPIEIPIGFEGLCWEIPLDFKDPIEIRLKIPENSFIAGAGGWAQRQGTGPPHPAGVSFGGNINARA
jgi:hypothetical protein